MTAIACVDKNNGIGKDGKLLISIPDDMKFFRGNTKDSIVVMGRKTLFSFKDKAPLKNRINIVFTRNDELKNEYKQFDNIFFVKNEDELNEIIEKYKDKKVFLIGGAKIYNDLIDKCDTCLITKLDTSFDADTFFPDLEKHGFTIETISETYTYEDIKYQFIKYKGPLKRK
ncbi:MAG: dihydrofolate reductase [Lachnospiraceae bacterium]|nr:dihydrofolate reductase [Lachnospiraceae bacterium]